MCWALRRCFEAGPRLCETPDSINQLYSHYAAGVRVQPRSRAPPRSALATPPRAAFHTFFCPFVHSFCGVSFGAAHSPKVRLGISHRLYCRYMYVYVAESRDDNTRHIPPSQMPSGQVTPEGAARTYCVDTSSAHEFHAGAASCRRWCVVWGAKCTPRDATGPVSEDLVLKGEVDRQPSFDRDACSGRKKEKGNKRRTKTVSCLCPAGPALQPCSSVRPCRVVGWQWLVGQDVLGGLPRWLFLEELAATPAKLGSSWLCLGG